jgi:hypothetical protein
MYRKCETTPKNEKCKTDLENVKTEKTNARRREWEVKFCRKPECKNESMEYREYMFRRDRKATPKPSIVAKLKEIEGLFNKSKKSEEAWLKNCCPEAAEQRKANRKEDAKWREAAKKRNEYWNQLHTCRRTPKTPKCKADDDKVMAEEDKKHKVRREKFMCKEKECRQKFWDYLAYDDNKRAGVVATPKPEIADIVKQMDAIDKKREILFEAWRKECCPTAVKNA